MSLKLYFESGNFNYIESFFKSSVIPTKQDFDDCLFMLTHKKTPNSIKKNIIMFLRKEKDRVDLDKLAKVFNVEKKIAEEILVNPITEAFFPAVSKTVNKLLRVYVVRLSIGKAIAVDDYIEDYLDVISFLAKSGFFIFFDDDFEGKSFMLAAFASVITESIPEAWAFSGGLDKDGSVISVGEIEQKDELCKNNGKRLISSEIINTTKELEYMLLDNKIDIPFSVAVKNSKTSDTPKEAAKENLSRIQTLIGKEFDIEFEFLKKLYDITDEDMVFYTDEEYLKCDNWLNHIKCAFDKLRCLNKKIWNKTVVFHFSFVAPATFVFGLGAIYGAKLPFVAYHFREGVLKKVLDFRNRSIRDLKTVGSKEGYLECIIENIDKYEAFVFYAASHEPKGDVERFMKNVYGNYGIVYCRLKDSQGNLKEKDWSAYVKEMYLIYNKTKRYDKIYKRMFFFSCPIVLAFGFGVCIETFEDIDIFNFNDNSYIRVFGLKELRV